MMNKQGVSLSFNTIIVAIIALLVLGIIIYLLVRGSGNFNEGTSCASKGGICAKSCDAGEQIGTVGEYCSDSTKRYCCSIIGAST